MVELMRIDCFHGGTQCYLGRFLCSLCSVLCVPCDLRYQGFCHLCTIVSCHLSSFALVNIPAIVFRHRIFVMVVTNVNPVTCYLSGVMWLALIFQSHVIGMTKTFIALCQNFHMIRFSADTGLSSFCQNQGCKYFRFHENYTCWLWFMCTARSIVKKQHYLSKIAPSKRPQLNQNVT